MILFDFMSSVNIINMSNPAAIFYYDEQATNIRSKLVQQGGKKLLISSVRATFSTAV